jgi:hypothetical protein
MGGLDEPAAEGVRLLFSRFREWDIHVAERDVDDRVAVRLRGIPRDVAGALAVADECERCGPPRVAVHPGRLPKQSQPITGAIDLERAVITVDESLVQRDNGDLNDGSTKSQAGDRSFSIPTALVPELAAHLERYVGPEFDARVFIGEKGGLLRRSNWHTTWEKARTQVGLPGFRLHDLRHTCNTLTAATGASTRELMHRMGHASPRAALRYQHATRERDVVIARALDQIIKEGTS